MAEFDWTDLIPVATSAISYGLTTNAANRAAGQQAAAYQQGINAYAPYSSLGASSVEQVRNLLGLSGSEKQQSAISALQASPEFQSMLKQGESSILSNAAATGGLRGGNTQAALAQYSPALLANLINQKVGTYTGLANSGQSAVGQMSNLYANRGAAESGSTLANANALNSLLSGVGKLAEYNGWFSGDGGMDNPDSSYWTNMDQGTATPEEVSLLF